MCAPEGEKPRVRISQPQSKAVAGKGLLRNNADWRCILWIVKYFVLSGLAWYYDDVISASVPLFLATSIVLAYYSFAGATIVHNTMHCRCFNDKTLEHIWHHVLSLTYGHPVSTFVPGHNLSHHRYTQTRMDPMRTTKLRYKSNLMNGIMFQPTVAWDVFKMDIRYLSLKSSQGDDFYTKSCREWIMVGTTQIALLILNWRKFLLFVWLPHFFAQWGIVSMNMLQHDGCDKEVDRDSSVEVKNYNGARNFVGPVINFLTFNNGYHTIHHMHPTMHWSRLKEEHERQVKPNIHPELDQQCMARYMYKAFITPGLRVDYLGNPVVIPDGGDGDDEDWTVHHAGDGVKLEDYDVDLSTFGIIKALPLLPYKLMCPTYSPVNKVD